MLFQKILKGGFKTSPMGNIAIFLDVLVDDTSFFVVKKRKENVDEIIK